MDKIFTLSAAKKQAQSFFSKDDESKKVFRAIVKRYEVRSQLEKNLDGIASQDHDCVFDVMNSIERELRYSAFKRIANTVVPETKADFAEYSFDALNIKPQERPDMMACYKDEFNLSPRDRFELYFALDAGLKFLAKKAAVANCYLAKMCVQYSANELANKLADDHSNDPVCAFYSYHEPVESRVFEFLGSLPHKGSCHFVAQAFNFAISDFKEKLLESLFERVKVAREKIKVGSDPKKVQSVERIAAKVKLSKPSIRTKKKVVAVLPAIVSRAIDRCLRLDQARHALLDGLEEAASCEAASVAVAGAERAAVLPDYESAFARAFADYKAALAADDGWIGASELYLAAALAVLNAGCADIARAMAKSWQKSLSRAHDGSWTLVKKSASDPEEFVNESKFLVICDGIKVFSQLVKRIVRLYGINLKLKSGSSLLCESKKLICEAKLRLKIFRDRRSDAFSDYSKCAEIARDLHHKTLRC